MAAALYRDAVEGISFHRFSPRRQLNLVRWKSIPAVMGSLPFRRPRVFVGRIREWKSVKAAQASV
jgi:hypothetical protein